MLAPPPLKTLAGARICVCKQLPKRVLLNVAPSLCCKTCFQRLTGTQAWTRVLFPLPKWRISCAESWRKLVGTRVGEEVVTAGDSWLASQLVRDHRILKIQKCRGTTKKRSRLKSYQLTRRYYESHNGQAASGEPLTLLWCFVSDSLASLFRTRYCWHINW